MCTIPEQVVRRFDFSAFPVERRHTRANQAIPIALPQGVLEDYPAVDAFSVVCLTSAVLGVIWLALMQRIALDLQGRPLQAWQAP